MIEVYHGGTEIVNRPLVNVGRPNLDFGPGFYITDIKEQAQSWARKIADIRGTVPVVSAYVLAKEELIANARYLKFEEYDRAWLDFICECRRENVEVLKYDVVEGGVADDRVINSVKMYMNGYIDAETTLNRLRYIKPNNQICINKQALVDAYLQFVDFETISANE